MRVIAGKHRGRRLAVPAGGAVRPTADRTREAVFNTLAHAGWGPGGASVLAGARVLDAFCGSGAYGLEALSRDAAAAVFLDTDRGALATVRRNAAALGEAERADIRRADATDPPPAPDAPGGACSLAFVDPPYDSGAAAPALAALATRGWLEPGAVCVAETAAKGPAPEPPPSFKLLDERTYGAARITYLRYEPAGFAL